MKVNIEVEIPDGYEFVRYGKASEGEDILLDGTVRAWQWKTSSAPDYVIVKEKKSDEQLVRELFDELCAGLKRLGYNDTGYKVFVGYGRGDSAAVHFYK